MTLIGKERKERMRVWPTKCNLTFSTNGKNEWETECEVNN